MIASTTTSDDELFSQLGLPSEDDTARLHARLVDRAGTEGLLDVAYRTVDTPYGSLLLAATPQGLVRLAFEGEDHDAVLARLAGTVSPRILRSGRGTDDAARQLDEYFDHRRRVFDVAVDLRLAHGFRRDVLAHLQGIAYGRTESYAAVAAATGHPKAVRAVGGACSHNPVPIIVPCHRVVRARTGASAATAAGSRPSAPCSPWRTPDLLDNRPRSVLGRGGVGGGSGSGAVGPGKFARSPSGNLLVPFGCGQIAVDESAAGRQPGRERGSHIRAVRSPLPVASSRPSGLNATPTTPPVWPVSGGPCGSPGRHIPQPRRLIAAGTGGGQQPAVRAERHPAQPAGVAGERRTVRLTGRHVPQPRRPVAAGGGQQSAVRAERHARYMAGVAGERLAVRLAGRHIPQPRPDRRRRWPAAGRPG